MKIIRADYIIGVAIILMLGTHGVTQYLIAKHSTITKTQKDMENFLQFVEGNPVAAWLLKFEKIRIIYSAVLAPALIFGMYYYHRRKYLEKDQHLVESFSVVAAMVFLINFFNDASYLFGFLLR
mgnify:CR=1 FL=1